MKLNTIKIIEYPGRPGYFDEPSSLCDNNIERIGSYGCLLNTYYSNESYIIFEISCTSNITAYGISYYDSGGSYGAYLSLYKKDNDDWVIVKDNIPSKLGWFNICDKLKQGTYKLCAKGNYVCLTELHAEIICSYALLYNNNIYTLNNDSPIIINNEKLTSSDINIDEIIILKNKINECNNYNVLKNGI